MAAPNAPLGGDDVYDIAVTGGPWDEGRDELFISLLEHEKARQKCMFTGSFTKASLNHVRVELSAQTGYEYTYDQVKNKWSQLETKQWDFLQIAQSTGVIPNYETGKLFAEDHIWDRLEKLYSHGKALRQKGFPHFLRISALVADSRATGKNVHASTKSPSETDSSSEKDSSDDDPEPGAIKRERLDDRHVLGDEVEGFIRDRLKGKRDYYSANLCHSISKIAASAKKKVSLLKQRAVDRTTMDECMNILNKMESEGVVDDNTYTMGVRVLTDPVKAQLLTKVPPRKWPKVVQEYYADAALNRRDENKMINYFLYGCCLCNTCLVLLFIALSVIMFRYMK